MILDGATAAERTAEASAFLAGFIAAKLLFTVVFAALVGWGRSMAGERLTRVANLLCVVTLAWFALSPVLRAL